MQAVTENSVKNSVEEQCLLDRISKGDRTAFWDLWNLHKPYLYSRCRVWMGGNAFDAEEALSLSALRAWNKMPTYAENMTNIRGWLNRLTHNLCVDLHRRQQRRAIGVDNIEDNQHQLPSLGYTETNDPETILLQEEFDHYLCHYIKTLPPRLRQPLILKYYENMSCIQIGEALAIKQNTVSKRLQEARALLKTRLSQYFSGLAAATIQDTSSQMSVKTDFKVLIETHGELIEEIDYNSTISCLEILSPDWSSSLQNLTWT